MRPARDPAALQRHGEELADLLLPAGPIRTMLTEPSMRRVLVSPHHVLHQLSFAALPLAGRPLIERLVVETLPYAGLVASAPPPRRQASHPAAVLAYAGDTGAPRLYLVSQEAEAIAALHQVAPRSGPPRQDVLAALTTSSVVHLSVHGTLPYSGRRDFLALDLPRLGPADSGDLSVVDILAIDGPLAADVVVLAACELATGMGSASDNGIGIPRALLEKGVGSVVAPLWRIQDDRPFLAMMSRLHAELRRGRPAAEALASVQREAIRDGVDPLRWASLVAIGYSRP